MKKETKDLCIQCGFDLADPAYTKIPLFANLLGPLCDDDYKKSLTRSYAVTEDFLLRLVDSETQARNSAKLRGVDIEPWNVYISGINRAIAEVASKRRNIS